MYFHMGKTGSDEIAPGFVTGWLSSNLYDFVFEVLSSCPNEWGFIYHHGGGRIEYRYGKLLSIIPPSWRFVRTSKITCAGGWSNMDYYVY